jgi:anti-anti-sigma factor
MIELKTDVEHETRIVSIEGELVRTTSQLVERLVGAVSEDAARVIIDLTRCDFLESTALGILVQTNSRLRSSTAQLSLVTPDRNVRQIFEMTGLDRELAIHPTQAVALNGRGRG